MHSWKVIYRKIILINILIKAFTQIFNVGLDFSELTDEKVMKYSSEMYLGTQVRTWDAKRPKTVSITASVRVLKRLK